MSTSIVADAVWAPAPSTTRGQATPLSADPKGQRLAYASNKSIFLRSIDDPAQSTQYTGHTAATSVARFAPSGNYVASGDVNGTVRIWDCIGEGGTKGEYHVISGRINDIAWDGESQRMIAVGEGRERLGRCFTADSGNSVGEIMGHSARINSVAIRPKRPLRAATASDDTNVVFLHGVPFKYQASLITQHTGFVFGVAFSPDAAHLVSVGADKHIWLYDGQTGDAKVQMGKGEPHKGSVYGVSWSSDSRHVVTSSADQTVKLWDIETQQSVQTWKLSSTTDTTSTAVAYQQVGVVWPQGRSDGLIISLSLNGDLNYLVQGSPQTTCHVRGHQTNITAMTSQTSSKATTLWTASYDGGVYSWNIDTGAAERVQGRGHQTMVSGLAASSSSLENRPADANSVYTVGWDDTLRYIDSSRDAYATASSSLQGQPCAVTTVNHSDLVVVVTNKSIEVYDHTVTTSIATMKTTFTPTAVTATVATSTPSTTSSSDPVFIVVGSDDATIRCYTLCPPESSSSPLRSLSLHTEFKSSTTTITALALSSSHRLLAVGHASGKIIVYHIDPSTSTKVSGGTSTTGSVLTDRWTAHSGRITSLAWKAPSDDFLLSASLDSHIMVWNVLKPNQMNLAKVQHAHKEGVNSVKWINDHSTPASPNPSQRFVSVGGDAAVKVWSVKGLFAK